MHSVRELDPTMLDPTLEERKPPPIESDGAITCVNPQTQEVLGVVPSYSEREVLSAVRDAKKAQKYWEKTMFSERKKILQTLLEHILEHVDELCEMLSLETGRTGSEVLVEEIRPTCRKLRAALSFSKRGLGSSGVVGVLAPRSRPLRSVLEPAVVELLAGNAVVVKASEGSSWSAKRIQRLFDEAFTLHGYPVELVTVVTGFDSTGESLCRSGVVRVVFSGSEASGSRVVRQCAEFQIPVALEPRAHDLSPGRTSSAEASGYEQTKEMIRLLYAKSFQARVAAIWRLIRLWREK